MVPTLYCDLLSPPTRSVLLTAKAIGLELHLKNTSLLKREQLNEEFRKINPQHILPTLVDEDGFVTWESHAMSLYLIEKYGRDDTLYPKDIKKRAVINRILHFSNGRLFEGLFHMTARAIIYKGQKEVPSSQIEDIKEVYSFFESFLENSSYAAGNELTVADLCIVTNITALSIFVPISSADFPRISSWMKRMESLPYYEEASQKGQDELKKLIISRLEQNNRA